MPSRARSSAGRATACPDQPEAWLLSVARNRTLDAWRHSRVQDEAAQTLLLLADEVGADAAGGDAVPDERLRLLFVCAHPAIDAAARAPLMLQTVLGLDAARMAGAFLIAPATLGQRLVRAKARIRAAGIPFEFPRAQRSAAAAAGRARRHLRRLRHRLGRCRRRRRAAARPDRRGDRAVPHPVRPDAAANPSRSACSR